MKIKYKGLFNKLKRFPSYREIVYTIYGCFYINITSPVVDKILKREWVEQKPKNGHNNRRIERRT